MNLLLGDGSSPRVPGAGGGLGRLSGSVCGGSPGGAGEGGVPQRPAGRPVPQFGQQRRRVAAAPQLRSGRPTGRHRELFFHVPSFCLALHWFFSCLFNLLLFPFFPSTFLLSFTFSFFSPHFCFFLFDCFSPLFSSFYLLLFSLLSIFQLSLLPSLFPSVSFILSSKYFLPFLSLTHFLTFFLTFPPPFHLSFPFALSSSSPLSV